MIAGINKNNKKIKKRKKVTGKKKAALVTPNNKKQKKTQKNTLTQMCFFDRGSRGVASVALVASAAARPIPESNVFQQYCRSGKHPTLSEMIDKESESDGEALAEVLVEEDGGNESDENSANVESNDLDVGSNDFALDSDSNPSSSSAEPESEAESDTDSSRTTLEERVL